LKQSRTTRNFWRLFSDLPIDVQEDARRAWRLFQSNPAHRGLQFKKLEGEDDLYSARIGLEYRALAVMKRKGRCPAPPNNGQNFPLRWPRMGQRRDP
jgi:hypothetical protein